jgi:hypothetical protein
MNDFLHDYYVDELSIDEILAEASAEGTPLHAVLLHFARASELLDEVVSALVVAAGSADAAQMALDAIPAFGGVRVEPSLARARADGTLAAAFERRGSVNDVVGLLESGDLDPDIRAQWLPRFARRFLVAELGVAVLADGGNVPLELLKAALPRTLLAMLEALADAGLSAEQIHTLLLRLRLTVRSSGHPPVDVATLHAALLVDDGRSVTAALRWIDASVPPLSWISRLRPHGLTASAAILETLERFPALKLFELATLMLAAGYGDELLEGLQKNGFGTATALKDLADSGWHVDRLVVVLLRRGHLASDARDQLLTLGLSMAAVRDVLLRHVPSDVADLVVPS